MSSVWSWARLPACLLIQTGLDPGRQKSRVVIAAVGFAAYVPTSVAVVPPQPRTLALPASVPNALRGADGTRLQQRAALRL